MILSPSTVGIIATVVLLVIMFLRLEVGVSMMLISLLGLWYLKGFDNAFQALGSVPYSQLANYSTICLPLFILMGSFLMYSSIGDDLYAFASKWVGHIRGGLAMATIAACGIFASICGNSTATALTVGKIAYPEMRKYGYSQSLAACTIVCGGTIGILIPPSVIMILYGLIVEQSIGRLFMAGIIPGIMQVIFYIITIWVIGKIKPGTTPAMEKATMKERVATIKGVFPVGILFLAIMVGIYGGIFTPTEAGGIGAMIALIIVIGMRRFNMNFLKDATKDAMRSATMVFCILIGAYLFMRLMAVSGLPTTLSNGLVTWQMENRIPPAVVVAVIMLVYFVLGMFLDAMAILLLTVPIITPVVVSMGFSPIWWGIMMVRFIEISMISPPYGLNLFIISKSTNTPFKTLYKGVWPFLAADAVHIALLIIFPQIVMVLPDLM